MPLILPLREAAAAERSLVGGKAARLARLLDAGLPVPDGFVVTTEAFRAHVQDPSVRQRINALAAQRKEAVSDGDDDPTHPAAAARLRDAIAGRELPRGVREAVRAALRTRGDRSGASRSWAVRSSATAEDLEEASFAGQHDTFLGVREPEAVLDRVRGCMASLFTDRAVAYRARTGIPEGDVAMAVLVQERVPAETAGVLFTADPVSGHRRTAVVEAVIGSGDELVAGEAAPDHVRIDRRTGEILSYQTATGEEGRRVLDDERLRELARLGGRIEALFGGRPQDVEWCVAENRLYVLQARPVTALPPVPEPTPSDDRLHVYLNMGPMQAVSEPMPPLVRDVWKGFTQGAMEAAGLDALAERWCAEAAGRVYIDMTPLLRVRLLGGRLASRLEDVSAPAAEGLMALLDRRADALRGEGGGLRALVGVLRAGGGAVAARLPRLAASFLGAFRGDPPDLDDERRFFEAFGRRAAAAVRNPSDPNERVRRALAPVAHLPGLREVHLRLAGLGAAFLAGAWLERLFPDAREEVDAVGRGFPREIVTRMNQQLGDLADVARRHPEAARALRDGKDLEDVCAAEGGDVFREAFEAYLEAFGHRATGEIDLSNPRWREDPSGLLRIVGANLAREEAGAHRGHLKELVREGEAAARRLVERAGRGPLGFVRRPLVRRLVHACRSHLPVREIPKQGASHLFAALRQTFLDAGEQLVETGRLERVDDVWYFRGKELLEALERGEPPEVDVEARRMEHERHRSVDAPVLLTSDGEDPSALVERGELPGGALRGTGVSAGVVEGPARVVRDPATSTVEPGEILVVPSCGPGWTPLFLNAAALVAEVGGRISHGALVAREYGLPAVVSVAGATREICTGQRVRVDGIRGVVEILGERAVPSGRRDDVSAGTVGT